MKVAACAVVLLVFVVIPARVHAEGSLAAARELYASAAYDDALSMLNGLASTVNAADERQSIDLYRTLCLVALGRTSDADHAIEAMVQRDPLYHASADDLSPRLRSAFDDVRRRLLPSIIQQEYAEAKTAFDRKDFAASAIGFESVLKAIADPEMAGVANVPPISDLRTLAAGFKDLSVKSAPPPAPAVEAKPARAVRSMYSAEDAGIIPPVAIEQKVPKYPMPVVKTTAGIVELVIDATGAVQSGMMRIPIDPTFDRLVLSAAMKWRYRPAMMDGMPVTFVKRLTISVSPLPQ
jgi:hypothetical protein